MLNQIDLIKEFPHILHAVYWVVIDVSNTLEEAKNKINNKGLKLHLTLSSKRFNIIAEHIRIVLEEVGIKPDERLEKEELRRRIGVLPIEALEDFEKTIKKIINEFIFNNKYEVPWLSSKLTETANIISIASSLLKIYLEILKKNEYTLKTCLILQTIIYDLEIIENVHRNLALNSEILIKDLSL
ncbi:MAG: hypothetical protein QXW27_00535 [Candidatus Methanomethylicaceae archaeon]